ncbi:MAG TPA: DUF4093 domain-containing protein [Candidatus Fimivicinus intestinavium]|nr:DUF4093 domain-containing protein [Candidatus Fimivicinus intestinavium]
MIRIRQAVIVEGKYDKIKLSSLLDTVIIPTDGFGIFKNKEKMNLIRRLAQTRGIVILTDSDAAGFKIRSYIGGSLPPEHVIHAYIPDIIGKERRKSAPSQEGKLGVEGMPARILMECLERAGVTCEETAEPGRRITKSDLYEDGLSGRPNSLMLRKRLLAQLQLPERLSANALVQVLNLFMTYEEYKQAVRSCGKTEME